MNVEKLGEYQLKKFRQEEVDRLTVPAKRHTSAADEKAFGKLYDATQEIAEIVHNVRDKIIGHKLAITEIEAILEQVS